MLLKVFHAELEKNKWVWRTKINEFLGQNYQQQKSEEIWCPNLLFFLNHQNNSVKYTTSSYSPSVFSNIRQKKEINPDDGIFGVE